MEPRISNATKHFSRLVTGLTGVRLVNGIGSQKPGPTHYGWLRVSSIFLVPSAEDRVSVSPTFKIRGEVLVEFEQDKVARALGLKK